MKFTRVTITGADNSTDPEALAFLSEEFPFVEWGILFSLSSAGNFRFPTLDWVAKLPEGLNYSAHLCGRYVRDLVLEANFTWALDHRIPVDRFKRIQLNFHGQFHRQHRNFSGECTLRNDAQYILQCDGVNDDAVFALCKSEPGRFVPLFDTSGGAGRLPSEWPVQWLDTECGYAGGLSPDNVVDQLFLIGEKVTSDTVPIWIDMERRVRSDDDSRLDLKKVRDVLKLMAPFVELPTEAT